MGKVLFLDYSVLGGWSMGVSFKVMPGVRVSANKRGMRTSVGPRIARVHVGRGGIGFSSGLGPVSVYGGSNYSTSSKSKSATSANQNDTALDEHEKAGILHKAFVDLVAEGWEPLSRESNRITLSTTKTAKSATPLFILAIVLTFPIGLVLLPAMINSQAKNRPGLRYVQISVKPSGQIQRNEFRTDSDLELPPLTPLRKEYREVFLDMKLQDFESSGWAVLKSDQFQVRIIKRGLEMLLAVDEQGIVSESVVAIPAKGYVS